MSRQELACLPLFDKGIDGNSEHRGLQRYCSEATRAGFKAGISLQEVVTGFTGGSRPGHTAGGHRAAKAAKTWLNPPEIIDRMSLAFPPRPLARCTLPPLMFLANLPPRETSSKGRQERAFLFDESTLSGDFSGMSWAACSRGRGWKSHHGTPSQCSGSSACNAGHDSIETG